jgi:hypothetical protein
MASAEYIAAAKQANRQPTVFMEIEEANAESLYYTTQSQFEGSDTLTQIDTDEEPGAAWHKKHNEAPTYYDIDFPFDVGTRYIKYTATEDSYLTDYIHGVYFATVPLISPESIKARVSMSKDVNFVTGVTTSDEFLLYPSFKPLVFPSDTRIIYGWDNTVLKDINLVIKMLTGEVWYLKTEISIDDINWQLAVHDTTWSTGYNINKISHVAEVAQLITSEIDFGEILTTTPTLSIDDITEGGETITYSYTYSDDDITYTAGGTIVDGDKLTPSRYYKVQADFFTTNGARGKVSELKLTEGRFRWYGTHINEPFTGVLPYLGKDPVSTLNQKIKIGKGLSTTGELSVKIQWVDDTSDLIASGYLKGQDVSIYSGFVGLSTDAYEPVLTGTWYDHDLDEKNRVITVKIRDALKQLEKRKLPEEVVSNIDGSITNRTLTYTTTSLVTVMKDIFDNIGLRDRYISPDFDTLEAGDYAANKYKVSRVIPKPTEATKLIDELAITGSMFLIPLGNGQIKPKPFDINQDHSVELDATQFNISNFKGNISEFFSRFYTYYNPKTTLTSDPSDSDDYDNGEKGTKQHFDKWKVGRTTASTPLTVPPQALIDLNTQNNALFTEPLYTLTLKQLPPRQANIEPADVIALSNLDLPVVDNAWAASASYSGKSFDVSNEATRPENLYFSEDGSKMFILNGGADQEIYQYSLSTNYEINTASYDSVSFDVGATTSDPIGLFFRRDGLKFYVVSLATDQTVYQYSMSSAWDLSTASYDSKSFDLSTDAALPQDVFFKPDGLVMYVVSNSGNSVVQFNLSTAWDVSTSIYNSVTASVSAQTTTPIAIFFKTDGSAMYVASALDVYQYDVNINWDLSNFSYSGDSLDVSSSTSPLSGIAVSSTGDKIYTSSDNTNRAYQYDIPNPWKLSAVDYTTGDKVIHDGRMWRARKDSTGKNPTSEAEFWQDTGILESGLTDKKHFFVMGRKFNPNTALIDLDLMEMPPSVLGGFDTGFSSGFNI